MFSFFNNKSNSSKKRVYLDNAGATEMLKSAQAELVRLLRVYGNPSAIHKAGAVASTTLDSARAKIATILNAPAYEVTFVGSGTESCNLAILGTYEAYATNSSKLPHIITSSIEHPAVLEPIKYLEKQNKITVTYLPVYDTGVVKVSDLRDALTEDTILVSIMYANNEIGTLQPVKEIGREISIWKTTQGRDHMSYPYFHTDACQAGNYLSLDVLRLKCHLMSINASKVYGPKAIGALYRREGVKLNPITYGGGQERGLRSATESVALASSFAIALEEVQKDKEIESQRLRTIRDDFKNKLAKEVEGVEFYGIFDEYNIHNDTHKLKSDNRLPNNLNFRIPGISSEEMILRLDAKGFAVSHKSACASAEDDGSYVIMSLGATETEAKENIRVTLGRFTTDNDMTALLHAIIDIVKKYRNTNNK
jgi:cysteine desulfurase